MKSKYETNILPNLAYIEAMRRDGVTEEKIASVLKVAYSTFNLYKLKYPELSEVLKKGKEVSIALVENALFKSAVGYNYEEVKTEYIERGKDRKNGNLTITDKTKDKKVTRTTKHVQGDVTAQFFFLKNRCSEKWADVHRVENKVTDSTELEKFNALLDKLTPEQRLALLKEMESGN